MLEIKQKKIITPLQPPVVRLCVYWRGRHHYTITDLHLVVGLACIELNAQTDRSLCRRVPNAHEIRAEHERPIFSSACYCDLSLLF